MASRQSLTGPTKVRLIIVGLKSFALADVIMSQLLSFNRSMRIPAVRACGLKRSKHVIQGNFMRALVKATLIIPIAVTSCLAVQDKPAPDPGFACSNGGLIVVAVENQTTRAIAKKYCTGDIEKADQALIKRYEGNTILQWSFIDVESLGTR